MFKPLLERVRADLQALSGGDEELRWALRRTLAKELTYDERSKPMQRRALKARKRKAQAGLCKSCGEALPGAPGATIGAAFKIASSWPSWSIVTKPARITVPAERTESGT